MKENVMLSPLSLSSNYVSNAYLFKMYKNNVIGLTGTLGSDKSKEILKKFYGAVFEIIPPNKERLLKLEDPIIC